MSDQCGCRLGYVCGYHSAQTMVAHVEAQRDSARKTYDEQQHEIHELRARVADAQQQASAWCDAARVHSLAVAEIRKERDELEVQVKALLRDRNHNDALMKIEAERAEVGEMNLGLIQEVNQRALGELALRTELSQATEDLGRKMVQLHALRELLTESRRFVAFGTSMASQPNNVLDGVSLLSRIDAVIGGNSEQP